jgi:very-short-patch-repair endonuclease
MPRKIIPCNPNLKELARKLRNDSTLGEVVLWNEIKGKKLYDYDFQRQKPLLNYIADFYCYELGLMIEVNGMYHYNSEQDELDVFKGKKN